MADTVVRTNAPAVLVPPPQAETNALAGQDIRDIKGPVEIPGTWDWVWWFAAALLLAAVSAFVWHRWLRKRFTTATPEIILPPHYRARQKLREALALLDQPQPFCVLVSHAIRVYLEERFAFHAPDRTTEEFLDELQSSPALSLTQKQSLADFLSRCDMVKFARDEPDEAGLRELYDSALRLVDETEPGASAGRTSTPIDRDETPVGTLDAKTSTLNPSETRSTSGKDGNQEASR